VGPAVVVETTIVWRRPATSGGRTDERTVGKIGGWIVEKTVVKTGGTTVVGKPEGSIGPTRWPETMANRGVILPA